MLKKVLATLLIVSCIASVGAPIPTFAATWSTDIKTVTIAEIAGAIDGYLQTENIGGAMGGALKSAIHTATTNGITGQEIPTMDSDENNFSALNHVGLDYLFERIQFNHRTLSDTSWEAIDRAILTYLWEEGYYNKAIDTYIKKLDPAYEATMARIKTASQNNTDFPLSEKFYSNLEKTLALLDGESDDPEQLIENAIQFFVDASALESGDELTQKNGGLTYGKIETTYKPQKSMSDNNDIIIAQLMAIYTRKSYDYWKAHSAFIKDNGSEVPEIIVPPIPPRTRGLEITLDKRSATVGIDAVTLDVAPFAENGRTMVPFKFVGESLGATVAWHPENASVSYVLGDQTVILYLDKNIALVDGNEVPIDENPLIIPRVVNQRTMVPVKFISEALGFTVTWDPIKRTVGIHTNPMFQSNDLSGDMIEE